MMSGLLQQMGLSNALGGPLASYGNAASANLKDPPSDGVTYAVRWYERGTWAGTRWAADPGAAIMMASAELHRLLFGVNAQPDVSVEVVRVAFTNRLQMDCVATLRPPAKE